MGHCNDLEVVALESGLPECLCGHRYHMVLVGARCQLRHDAAIGLVYGLAGDHTAEQLAPIYNGDGRLVAGGFNGKQWGLDHRIKVWRQRSPTKGL